MSLSLDLPPQWQAAFGRDHAGMLTGNDPAQERRTARLLSAFIVSGLVFAILPERFWAFGIYSPLRMRNQVQLLVLPGFKHRRSFSAGSA
jgi:hypothetical protein